MFSLQMSDVTFRAQLIFMIKEDETCWSQIAQRLKCDQQQEFAVYQDVKGKASERMALSQDYHPD